MGYYYREYGCSVRAVLEEAASPATAAPATTGTAKATIGGGNVDVPWVQLWENGPKFAEYNVGVTDGKAESYGGYYAWGGSQNKVDDHNKNNTGTGDLSGTDDTATNLWGSKWRMPTADELGKKDDSGNYVDGLLGKCTVETVFDPNDDTKILGKKFTGQGDYSSNSIFLPAAGLCSGGTVFVQGDPGYYWSSTPDGSGNAYYLNFSSGDQRVYSSNRDYGYPVRAVLNE